MLLQNPVDFSFQTQRKRRRQTQEMEWLGEEQYNPGVPVWRGEPQVRVSNKFIFHINIPQID